MFSRLVCSYNRVRMLITPRPMNKYFLLLNKQIEVEDAERFYSDLEVTLNLFVFCIDHFTLRSSWNIHRQYQIDVLASDPENGQKNVDFDRRRGIELANKLVAPEDHRGGGFVPPIVLHRGDTFHRAARSFVIVGQGLEMEPVEPLLVISPVGWKTRRTLPPLGHHLVRLVGEPRR